MRVGMVAGLLHRAVDAVINRMCQLLLLAAFKPLARNAGLEAAFMAALYICNDIIFTNSHGVLLEKGSVYKAPQAQCGTSEQMRVVRLMFRTGYTHRQKKNSGRPSTRRATISQQPAAAVMLLTVRQPVLPYSLTCVISPLVTAFLRNCFS